MAEHYLQGAMDSVRSQRTGQPAGRADVRQAEAAIPPVRLSTGSGGVLRNRLTGWNQRRRNSGNRRTSLAIDHNQTFGHPGSGRSTDPFDGRLR